MDYVIGNITVTKSIQMGLLIELTICPIKSGEGQKFYASCNTDSMNKGVMMSVNITDFSMLELLQKIECMQEKAAEMEEQLQDYSKEYDSLRAEIETHEKIFITPTTTRTNISKQTYRTISNILENIAKIGSYHFKTIDVQVDT